MSESEPETAEVELTKTVQIVGYLKPDIGEVREWADSYDEEVDYFEQEVRDHVERYLVAGELEKEIVSRSEWEQLVQVDLGEAELVEKRNPEKVFTNDPPVAAESLAREIFTEKEWILPMGLEMDTYWLEVNGGGGRVANVFAYTDDLPMLKHQSNIEPGSEDVFVDEEVEYPAVKYKVRIGTASKEVLEAVNNEVVSWFVKQLATHPEIEKVRFLDCEEQQTTKGACYRL